MDVYKTLLLSKIYRVVYDTPALSPPTAFMNRVCFSGYILWTQGISPTTTTYSLFMDEIRMQAYKKNQISGRIVQRVNL
jgi:hypothetical protein